MPLPAQADPRFANKLDFNGDRVEYLELSLVLWCLSVPEALKGGVPSPAKSDVESATNDSGPGKVLLDAV